MTERLKPWLGRDPHEPDEIGPKNATEGERAAETIGRPRPTQVPDRRGNLWRKLSPEAGLLEQSENEP